MVLCRGWDNDEELFQILEQDRVRMTNCSTLPVDYGICIPTCNFDTYIRQFGDIFVIQTCNNHSWYMLDWQTVSWEYCPPTLLKELQDFNVEYYKSVGTYNESRYIPTWGDLADECEFHLSKTGKYWYPVYRLFGREPVRRTKYACSKGRKDGETGYIASQHHVDEVQLENGDIVCPLCYKECIITV